MQPKMLTTLAIPLLVALAACTTPALSAGPHQWGREAVTGTDAPNELTPGERATLVQMREEEKVARDVYRTLGETWGLAPFLHIQASEQGHFEVTGDLLERYGVPDPIVTDVQGQFSSREMKALYDELVRTGKRSEISALQVGARIEELDIVDLERAVAEARDPVLRATYENLLRASRNHLRAFAGNLRARGASYSPQHLPADRFWAIADGTHERCGGTCRGTTGTGMAQVRRGQGGSCCGSGGPTEWNRPGGGRGQAGSARPSMGESRGCCGGKQAADMGPGKRSASGGACLQASAGRRCGGGGR